MHSKNCTLELSFRSTGRAKRSLLMAALFAAGFAQVAGAASANATNGGEQAVRELIDALEAANNGGDAERWAGFFADDFVYMVPGMPAVTRREELLEVARAGFRNKAAIAIDTLEVQVCGDWAFARTAVSGSVTLHTNGESIAVDAKELLVLVRGAGGSWRIARLMNNSNR